MNVLLSLSVCSALLMWTCSGNTESDESPTDYDTTTAYYDYDYNATFEYIDYYFVNTSVPTIADNEQSLSPTSSEAFGTEELNRVLVLGLAVLQIWI